MTINSQPWFGKEINKILSVSASKASNAFNWYFHNHKPYTINLLAEFDCRGFVVPEYEIINTFLFRQQDAARNSVQMIGRSHFSHKELHNKSNSEIQEMLFQKHNINWNDVPIHHKRGACVYKKDVQKDVPARDEKGKIIEGKFESTVRGTWIIDKEIPIFSQDKNFINKYTKV
jgi:tRNA(His) 5'-end guanylyltransferase